MIDPFRKQALDRISSPEELDRLVRVARPGTWIALAGFLVVIAAVLLWATFSTVTTTVSGIGFALPEGGLVEAVAPEPGIVERIETFVGERVDAGERVALLGSADGRDVEVVSFEPGTVGEVLHDRGDYVEEGAPVVIVQRDTPLVIEAFLPQSEAPEVTLGDRVWVAPSSASPSQYGYAIGTVARIGQFPLPPAGIRSILESPAGADLVSAQGPVVRTVVRLEAADTPSGVAWTASSGPPSPIEFGTPADVRVVTGERAPIDYVLG